MNRRDFISLSLFLTGSNSFADSFSLKQMQKVSRNTNKENVKDRVNQFINYALPKIIVKNTNVQKSIKTFCEPLFETSNRAVNWKVFIVNKGGLACTYGAGLILINIDLIKLCDNETQLASVLAHEIGHIHHKHLEKKITMNQIYNYFDVKNFKNSDINLLSKSFSRMAEREADAYIIKAFLKTGYSIDQASAFFHKLEKVYPENGISIDQCLRSTHPQHKDRINKLDKIVSTYTQIQIRSLESEEFKYLKNWSGS